MADEFEVIAPAAERIVFAGAERCLAPLTVAQIPRVARAIKAIGVERLGGALQGDAAALLDLLAEHGGDLIDLVAVAAGIEREAVERALPDEFVSLAATLARVNADFFGQRLLPAIQAAMPTGAPERGAGPMPSSA
ncbi:MAG: hypothetical protein KGZ43_10035 [Sulfuritalea sp.]|nr:hypothetical protein [Sulfuritalea sp.]